MLSRNDAVESFFNSVQVAKGALSPLEFQIQKAAKDFEYCWPGSNNGRHNLAVFAPWTGVDKSNSEVHRCSLKKKNGNLVASDEKKEGFSIRLPIKTVLGFFSPNPGSDFRESQLLKVGKKEKESGDEDGSRVNCFRFAVTGSLLLGNLVQSIPNPFKISKKRLRKFRNEDTASARSCRQVSESEVTNELRKREADDQSSGGFLNDAISRKKENRSSLECLIGPIFAQCSHNLQKFDLGNQNSHQNRCESCPPSSPQSHHSKAVASILENTQVDRNGFWGNLSFARLGGTPSGIIEGDPSVQEGNGNDTSSCREESGGGSPQKLPNELLRIPLSNVERLRSTLSTVSLAELIELVPLLGRPTNDYPDKKKLFSVQDFFRYTEAEGRRFFEELDRDGDGQITSEDLEIALGRRKLPKRYAREFIRRTRNHLFSKSFGWKQFLSLMEQKEPTILRAYTTLCLSKSGTLQKTEILASLKNAGLPANEDNAVAMMRFLNADTEESISYGHFRNFMLLLPSDRLQDDPRSIWFEAATVVAVEPPVEIPAGSVLRSALAGGLASALSTSVMHPVDSIKTRVQASTLSFPEIVSKLPEIGIQGLYRGSIPAILGQFSSHGLRTGIFEASKLVLINVAPEIPEIQVQSLASFCSTFLGTAVRIPCEVLKQRLQAGIFENVGEAILGTWQQDGLKGFFRGTGATLCREVPFYVAGLGLYAESKKAAQGVVGRELEPWETVVVGAVSGGLAAVVTTPFDVLKTRMMTAHTGRVLPMSMVAFSVIRREGLPGLFKGALPRFFWIAPLGAMNFAGYELARKAMDKNQEPTL